MFRGPRLDSAQPRARPSAGPAASGSAGAARRGSERSEHASARATGPGADANARTLRRILTVFNDLFSYTKRPQNTGDMGVMSW